MDKRDVVHTDNGMGIPQKQNGVHRQVVDTIPERLFVFSSGVHWGKNLERQEMEPGEVQVEAGGAEDQGPTLAVW